MVSGTSISATGISAMAATAQFKWVIVSANRFGLQSVSTQKYVQIPKIKIQRFLT